MTEPTDDIAELVDKPCPPKTVVAEGINQPLPLTKKNLALLNTFNGDAKRKKRSSYFESDDTMTISTAAPGFEQKAYENGIFDPIASRAPHDLNAICHRLT